ncbi:unnamed protein product, partial [Ceratitis capitata]
MLSNSFDGYQRTESEFEPRVLLDQDCKAAAWLAFPPLKAESRVVDNLIHPDYVEKET